MFLFWIVKTKELNKNRYRLQPPLQIRHSLGRGTSLARLPFALQVSAEAVVLAGPQLMLAFNPALHAAWQRWPQVPAVAKGLQVTVDQDTISRPGPRLAGAAEQLCTTLDRARQKLGLTPR